MPIQALQLHLLALCGLLGGFGGYWVRDRASGVPCVCDCTPASHSEVLRILSSQLDRCGPEQLSREVAKEVGGDSRLWVLLVCGCVNCCLLFFGIRYGRSLTTDAGAELIGGAPLAIEDAPRWAPSGRSGARRI
jgi:hypothetical protein